MFVSGGALGQIRARHEIGGAGGGGGRRRVPPCGTISSLATYRRHCRQVRWSGRQVRAGQGRSLTQWETQAAPCGDRLKVEGNMPQGERNIKRLGGTHKEAQKR